MKPYVGITGVRSKVELDSLKRLIESYGLPSSHQLMVGVLTSYKGLSRGILADSHQYVLPKDVETVFIEDSRMLNLLHYNSRAGSLMMQLEDILSDTVLCDGVQLNIAWPPPAELKRWRERSRARITLQVSARAYAEVGTAPDRLVKRLAAYEGLVDAVLLDMSGGLGREIDGTEAQLVLRAFLKARLTMKFGVAGGLTYRNLHEVLTPIRDLYPGLSFDAQARLRSASTKTLDLDLCERYIAAAVQLLLD